jgi:heat shock protein HtpX
MSNSAYSQQSRNIRKTWFLLFIFVGLVSGLCYSFAYLYNNYWIAIFGLLLSLGQAFVAYQFGDKIALMSAGAVLLKDNQYPELQFLVENLSKIAGIPVPKIYISPDKSANAFACGRDPEHASVCFNQGILELLNKNELEGVIAHELSHIKNRDILVMTVTMVLASLISFLSDIGLRMMFFGGNNKDNDNKSPILILIYIVVIILVPILSFLIQMAVSRSREYLADASAVTLTRYPKGLSDALQKLYNNPTQSSHYSTAMNHFYIAPPKKAFGEKVSGLFSTHPPINERIAALNKMG